MRMDMRTTVYAGTGADTAKIGDFDLQGWEEVDSGLVIEDGLGSRPDGPWIVSVIYPPAPAAKQLYRRRTYTQLVNVVVRNDAHAHNILSAAEDSYHARIAVAAEDSIQNVLEDGVL